MSTLVSIKKKIKTNTSWCLRDHLGWFVMAETTWLDGNFSIVEGEALALLEALKPCNLDAYHR
jgi:hypothetical protein